MEMSVYDEKSDFDNPFVEPLFDLNIYKAKLREVNDDLVVKTKVMKFAIRCDQVFWSKSKIHLLTNPDQFLLCENNCFDYIKGNLV